MKQQRQHKYSKNMRPTYNKSKIMRNAWYILKVKMMKTFADALRKAWRNEKLRIMQCIAEGRTIEEPKASTYQVENSSSFAAGCLAYYAEARPGQYFGD